jgi:hypothetical protein
LLIATNYLSREKYLKYKTKGVNIFLYNEINFSTIGLNDDVFLNCNSEKVPSTWFTWDENDKLLQSFKLKYPQFFTWNGYDMTLVFQKMLFWTNYKTGFLWYCKNKFYPTSKVYHIDSLHPYNMLKTSLRYLKVKYSRGKIKLHQVQLQDSEKKSGIHLKDDFELGLYENFIKEASKTGQYRLFYEKKLSPEKIGNLGFEQKDVTLMPEWHMVFEFPSINLARVRGAEWYMLSSLSRHWEMINKWMYKAGQMASSGISRVVMNEAENGVYGACMGEVLNKHGIATYNTMNGLKAGQAQDAYINFSKWFVWDEQMKKMLMEKCGLDSTRLIVSGHLMEDFANDYTYQNSLDVDREALKDKKVISVFSIRSKREGKLSALNYLYSLVQSDPSIFLIIRPHPAEKSEDFVRPDFESDRIHWVSYNQKNSKATLYDQICLSDICVVFGSTVALECKWFGKSCITYEPRQTSLLYFVDGYETVHVTQVDQFKKELDHLLEEKHQGDIVKPLKTVASRMVEYLSKN